MVADHKIREYQRRARPLERVPMRSNHLSIVMPALVAGIYVFLAGLQ
jgi:hypothetical protein